MAKGRKVEDVPLTESEPEDEHLDYEPDEESEDEESEDEQEEDQEELTREQGLTLAYGRATTRLRNEERDRFNELYAEEAAALGFEWTPKPTAEQRAKQEILELLSEFPELRDDPDLRFDEGREDDAEAEAAS